MPSLVGSEMCIRDSVFRSRSSSSVRINRIRLLTWLRGCGSSVGRTNRSYGMFKNEPIETPVIHDDRKPIETLNRHIKTSSIHQLNSNQQLIPTRTIKKQILDILSRRLISQLIHFFFTDRYRSIRLLITAASASGCSPGKSIQCRLGSLRNQINCRRA